MSSAVKDVWKYRKALERGRKSGVRIPDKTMAVLRSDHSSHPEAFVSGVEETCLFDIADLFINV